MAAAIAPKPKYTVTGMSTEDAQQVITLLQDRLNAVTTGSDTERGAADQARS
ncbi:MAG TPA: hypothetical protein VH298_08070 [Jatrophihabitans sp.]|nr:hypothetical protein [Jatrophihabitans sp.]